MVTSGKKKRSCPQHVFLRHLDRRLRDANPGVACKCEVDRLFNREIADLHPLVGPICPDRWRPARHEPQDQGHPNGKQKRSPQNHVEHELVGRISRRGRAVASQVPVKKCRTRPSDPRQPKIQTGVIRKCCRAEIASVIMKVRSGSTTQSHCNTPVPNKHFVFDTNILLHDPRAILQFGDNEVIVPIFVLEEIDTFKKEASDRGRNRARWPASSTDSGPTVPDCRKARPFRVVASFVCWEASARFPPVCATIRSPIT